MNKQIDINDNPLDSSQTDKLSVAQKGGGTMVVGMKEGQGLLLEEQEDGIEKFEVLGQIVELSSLSAGQHFKPRDQENTYIVQDNEGLGPSTLVITNGEEETVSVERRQKLLNEESEKSRADRGQVEVVDHEQCVELKSRAVLHQLATTEDDDVVGHECNRCLLKGRHWRHPFDKLELAGWIAHNSLESLVENRP